MFRSKITTVAAFTALAVAVLGTTPVGHAAGKLVLGKSSVGTSQLKKNAVTSAKVKNRSLLAVDFKKGQLPAGPQGPQGQKGDQGPKGDSGVAHLSVVNRQSAWTNVPAGGSAIGLAHCQPNEIAVGGGPVGLDPDMRLLSSYAAEVPVPVTWHVTVYNADVSAHSFSVEVVCAAS